MAVRKKAKPAATKLAPSAKAEAPEVQPTAVAEKNESKPQGPAERKQGPARRRPRTKPRRRKREAPKREARRPKGTRKRHRGRYSDAERARILKAAFAQRLTAQQVQEKFGVQPVTYYSWRKKAKATHKRAPRPARKGRPQGGELAGLLRESVQARLRQMLPGIVRSEVAAYLVKVFGKGH